MAVVLSSMGDSITLDYAQNITIQHRTNIFDTLFPGTSSESDGGSILLNMGGVMIRINIRGYIVVNDLSSIATEFQKLYNFLSKLDIGTYVDLVIDEMGINCKGVVAQYRLTYSAGDPYRIEYGIEIMVGTVI